MPGARGAYEVDTNCGDVGLGVCVVGESQKQAGLSNTGVTDEEELEEVVVSRRELTEVEEHRGRCLGVSSSTAGPDREMLCRSRSAQGGSVMERRRGAGWLRRTTQDS